MGSNIGDREAVLEKACGRLLPHLQELRVSSVYETKAVDYTEQPDFLNIAVCGRTVCDPDVLLERILEIESELGRVRDSRKRFGPRVVDIDLLLYENRILHTPELTVPHPRMTLRRFVLIPLLELDDSLCDPISGRKYTHFLDRVSPQGVYYFTLNLYS